jgi:hypothetical protein
MGKILNVNILIEQFLRKTIERPSQTLSSVQAKVASCVSRRDRLNRLT